MRSQQEVRFGVLAAAILALELIAGMQSFMLATVVPIVALDLDAHQFYGAITGIAQIAMFVTMPLGPWLLQRFAAARLLMWLTMLAVVGGVLSALAPSVSVFLLGRAVSGLSGGALAVVSLAAIVSVLPSAWRRMVLASYNVVWVAASLVGPLYAAWITSVLSWRWALVLYLPLLLVARAVVAHQLGSSMQAEDRGEPLTIGAAAALAGGVALLSVVGLAAVPAAAAIVAALVGLAIALAAAHRLLPAGVLRAGPGRPASLATMGLLTGAYFGAEAIVAILVHDLLSGTPTQVGMVIAGGPLTWALVGLYVARRPAQACRRYVRRVQLGGLVLALGLLVVLASLTWRAPEQRIPVLMTGWVLAGAGMGLVYLDTLNHIVDVPPEADGVSVNRAAASTVLVEAIAAAGTSTIAAAVLGRAISSGAGSGAATGVLVALAGCALMVGVVANRQVLGFNT